MGVEYLDKIKKRLVATNYSLAKSLKTLGIDANTQGLDCYDKKGARNTRLDILVGLKHLSGLSWDDIGKSLEREFNPKRLDDLKEARADAEAKIGERSKK